MGTSRHLYLSYSPGYLNEVGIDTINEHISIDQKKGEVIWGQFTRNQHQKQFDSAKIRVLDEQVKKGIPTYVFFHSSKKGDSEKLYKAEYLAQYGRKEIPVEEFELIPSYYHDKVNQDPKPGVYTCKSYVKVRNLQEVSLDILSEMFSIQTSINSVKEALEREPRPKSLLYVYFKNEDLIDDELTQEPIDEEPPINEISIEDIDVESIFVDPPKSKGKTSLGNKNHNGNKPDYIQKAINDKNLGIRGEKFVIKVEKKKLILQGRSDLLNRVEHVSEDEGDGLGYDIKSIEIDPESHKVREIYIEVKTTKSNIMTPFIVTKTEVDVSKEFEEKGKTYYVYRVFSFNLKKDEGKIYRIKGNILSNFECEPETYKARLK